MWEKLVRPKLLLIFAISFFRSYTTPLLVICPYPLVSLFFDSNGELSKMKPSCIMIFTGNNRHNRTSSPTQSLHTFTGRVMTSDRPKLTTTVYWNRNPVRHGHLVSRRLLYLILVIDASVGAWGMFWSWNVNLSEYMRFIFIFLANFLLLALLTVGVGGNRRLGVGPWETLDHFTFKLCVLLLTWLLSLALSCSQFRMLSYALAFTCFHALSFAQMLSLTFTPSRSLSLAFTDIHSRTWLLWFWLLPMECIQWRTCIILSLCQDTGGETDVNRNRWDSDDRRELMICLNCLDQ